MLKLPDIREVQDVTGKRVLVRVDFNVPIIDGEVASDFRIKKSLETISFLAEKGARVILVSHRSNAAESLSEVAAYLEKYITLTFIESVERAEIKEKVNEMRDGDIILLENVRRHKGEVGNDDDFAAFLASLADVYVNEVFSASHRAHASVVGVPKLLPHYAGILFQKEMEELSKACEPKSPSLFIFGGAKFETKEPLIRKFLKKYDHVFVGGALAHDFLKARGYNVGKSLVSEHAAIGDIVEDEKIILPKDVVVRRAGSIETVAVEHVLDNDVIDDVGPETIGELKGLIADCAFILWNGTLGHYEEGFGEATEELAKAIAESSAESVVGGGDTVASIEGLGLEEKFTFLSTGGGAMIEFLSTGTLPGIEALMV